MDRSDTLSKVCEFEMKQFLFDSMDEKHPASLKIARALLVENMVPTLSKSKLPILPPG